MILWLEVIQEPLYSVLYVSKSAMVGWIDTSTLFAILMRTLLGHVLWFTNHGLNKNKFPFNSETEMTRSLNILFMIVSGVCLSNHEWR